MLLIARSDADLTGTLGRGPWESNGKSNKRARISLASDGIGLRSWRRNVGLGLSRRPRNLEV
jgi:hypothetical protein